MSFRELSGVVAVCDALCGSEGPIGEGISAAAAEAQDAGFVKYVRADGVFHDLLCPSCAAEAVGMPAETYIRIAVEARARKEGLPA